MADFDQSSRTAWIRWIVDQAAGEPGDFRGIRALVLRMATTRGLPTEPIEAWFRPLPGPPGSCAAPEPTEPPPGDPAFLAECREALHANAAGDRFARKQSNAFPTPTPLADQMAESLLEPRRPRRILDPACGAGALLLAVARRVPQDPQPVTTQLLGTDIDPIAIALARSALWFELTDQGLDPDTSAAELTEWIRVADGLDEAPESVDGLIANPPWDQLRWDDAAFFVDLDPEHRTRKRREADAIRDRLLRSDPELERRYHAAKQAHADLVKRRRGQFPRASERGIPHLAPMFVEAALHQLRPGGSAVLLVPSGLHTDFGCRALREELLTEHEVDLWIGFENRARLFPRVDGRFRFDLLRVRKSGSDSRRPVRCGFLNTEPRSIDELAPIAISPADIQLASPASFAMPELRGQREADLFFRLAERNHRFDAHPDLEFEVRREFDLTLDRSAFVHRDQHRESGVDLVPLIEGRHIEAFRPNAKAYVEGSGRRARWDRTEPSSDEPTAQYYVPRALAHERDPLFSRPKVGLMAIASATNTRSAIATPLQGMALGNSVLSLRCRSHGGRATLALAAVLNSFVYDWWLRRRLGGLNLNRFLLEETPVPPMGPLWSSEEVADLATRLTWPNPRSEWIDPVSRRRARARLDAIVARAFGCDRAEFEQILESNRDEPRGFWRVDKELPEGERLPHLALEAFDREPAAQTSSRSAADTKSSAAEFMQ